MLTSIFVVCLYLYFYLFVATYYDTFKSEVMFFTQSPLCSTSDAENSEELISVDKKSSVDGWHTIQFSGGKNAPTMFDLVLYWRSDSTQTIHNTDSPLLKLRTDRDIITPITERVLSKLPRWCSLFGKSTSPHTLAFLRNLPVNF